MKSLALFLLFITSFFVRALRWLSFLQQKEYRFDRIVLFLKSKEGKTELLRIFPKKSDFSRTGLKRPKLTGRSLVMTLIFFIFTFVYFKLFLLLGYLYLLKFYPYPVWYTAVLILLTTVVYLLFIPLFVMVSAVPTAVLAYFQTFIALYKAKQKIDQGKPQIIGITGSYGKTTTKLLLTHVLEQKYSVFTTPKSFNTKYSVAQSISKHYSNQEIAILEFAAYKRGEIKSLASWFKPSFVIITGLIEQHLGLFGTLQDIISAKSELVASLNSQDRVICNAYDEQTKQICEVGREKNKVKVSYITPDFGQVKLEDVKLNPEGKLQFIFDGKKVQTQLLGIQYKEIVHLVIAAARAFQMQPSDIITALTNFVPNEKFIYSYKLASGVRIIDDGGTSNPKGFSAAITLAKSLSAQRKIVLTPGIVDLGTKSTEIHLELANLSKKVFDKVIFVGESGKEEFQKVFGDDILTTPGQFSEIVSSLNADDLIVIEGRMPAWITKELQ